jgi:hypothetical protein
MEKLEQILLEFESYLKSQEYSRLNLLQPGLEEKKCRELLRTVAIDNKKLTQFYCWKNGISEEDKKDKVIGELELFPFGIMLSLNEALAIYDIYVVKDKLWSKYLFPIFTNGGGDFLLFDCSSKKKKSGCIFLYSPSIFLSEDSQSCYVSIESLFETILTCFKEGAFKVNKTDGYVVVDNDLEYNISYKFNPGMEFWSL